MNVAELKECYVTFFILAYSTVLNAIFVMEHLQEQDFKERLLSLQNINGLNVNLKCQLQGVVKRGPCMF